MRDNRVQVLERLGASYQKEKNGALRQIPQESLDDLKSIFDETGATARFEKIERLSELKAKELGIGFSKGKDDYFNYLYNGTQK